MMSLKHHKGHTARTQPQRDAPDMLNHPPRNRDATTQPHASAAYAFLVGTTVAQGEDGAAPVADGRWTKGAGQVERDAGGVYWLRPMP